MNLAFFRMLTKANKDQPKRCGNCKQCDCSKKTNEPKTNA